MKLNVFLSFSLLFSLLFFDLQSQTYRILVIPQGSNKHGYVDITGQLIIDPIYKNALDFSEYGTALVFDGQKKLNPGNLSNSRIINVSGVEIANISDFNLYDDPWSGFLSVYNSGILRVLKKKLFGALNCNGDIVVPFIYDELTDFDNDYALGKRNKKYYVVSSTGKEKLIEGNKITYIKHFSEGLAPVEIKGQKFGFIDTLGNIVIKPEFVTTGYFSGGYCWVRAKDNQIGYINNKGEWVARPQFGAARSFDRESGLAMVKKDGVWGFLDSKGNVHYFEATEKAYGFSEGLAIGKKNGLFGFINNKGDYEIDAVYKEALPFNNGYARVEKDGKWGLIDKKGNWIIIPTFKKMGKVILINEQ